MAEVARAMSSPSLGAEAAAGGNTGSHQQQEQQRSSHQYLQQLYRQQLAAAAAAAVAAATATTGSADLISVTKKNLESSDGHGHKLSQVKQRRLGYISNKY